LSIPTIDGDLFCSGHSWTEDGHLLVAGGNRHVGAALAANKMVWRFDPTVTPTGNAMWVREPDMAYERWYPTVTTLGADSTGLDLVAITGGFDFATLNSATTYEVFDPNNAPGSGTYQVDPGTGSTVFPGPTLACDEIFALYPRQHLLSSGRLFFSGMTERGYRLDQTKVTAGGPPVWDAHVTNPFPGWHRNYGSSFLFPNLGGPAGGFTDIVVKIAGAPQFWTSCLPSTVFSPIGTMEFCFADLPNTNPLWSWSASGPSLAFLRYHQNATLLPDATVLVTSGNLDLTSEFDCFLPVQQTELLNDLPFAWRTLATAGVRRGYHSTAALLPDGRVLVGGGEQREADYEIFSPHYLTNGTTRPQILNAPATLNMSYGQNYTLEYAPGVTVERAVLMAPASLTHHSDMHQRYWEMQTVTPPPPNPNPFFSFTAPTSSGQAPKGYYMLFLVSTVQTGANRGTPSVATWVRLQ
jgi:galactose oxidase